MSFLVYPLNHMLCQSGLGADSKQIFLHEMKKLAADSKHARYRSRHCVACTKMAAAELPANLAFLLSSAGTTRPSLQSDSHHLAWPAEKHKNPITSQRSE